MTTGYPDFWRRAWMVITMYFITLKDTPHSYIDQTGKVPAVKTTEDGLEFVSYPPNLADLPEKSYNSLTDVDLTTSFKKARAYLAVDQNIPDNIDTKVEIDTDSFDPFDMVDLANHRIKPTTAGYYLVIGHVLYESYCAGSAGLSLYFNGTEEARGAQQQNGFYGGSVSDLIYFNGIDDYVELWTSQFSLDEAHLLGGTANNFLEVLGPF